MFFQSQMQEREFIAILKTCLKDQLNTANDLGEVFSDEWCRGEDALSKRMLAFYCILAFGYDVLVKIFELLFPVDGLHLQFECSQMNCTSKLGLIVP